MSINIHFIAEREIYVPSINKYDLQIEHIDVWQTPTDVSRDIHKAKDVVQAYFNWVLSVSEEIEKPVYADDDIFCEKEPIKYEKYHPGKEHIEELKDEFDVLKKEGYKIKSMLL